MKPPKRGERTAHGNYGMVPEPAPPVHRCEDGMRDVRELEAEVGTTWICDCGKEWALNPGFRWVPSPRGQPS